MPEVLGVPTTASGPVLLAVVGVGGSESLPGEALAGGGLGERARGVVAGEGALHGAWQAEAP